MRNIIRDIELYKESGQDFSNDIQTPDSTKLDYVDNDNNNRVRDSALAKKELDKYLNLINAKYKQDRQSNNG